MLVSLTISAFMLDYITVFVCLKGEVVLCGCGCVILRVRVYVHLSCVNDSSVTMYFGESDPHFMVQRCNSVCRLSIHCCDDVFKLYPMSKFV